MIEMRRPEYYGFESSKRNWRLFNAFMSQSHAWVYQDDGSTEFDSVLALFQKQNPNISPLNMNRINSLKQLLKVTGMKRDKYGYDCDHFKVQEKYLVFRRFDEFVADHQNGLESGGKISNIYQLMRVLVKYSVGTMFTVKSKSGAGGVFDKISVVSRKCYELKELIDDHSVIYVIPESDKNL